MALHDIPPETRRQLAASAGINDQYLYQVLTRRRVPSAELCVVIERESARAITRKDLRPNDWQDIWPELVVKPAGGAHA